MTRIKYFGSFNPAANFTQNTSQTEGFNDMCILYNDGETDIIQQDRLRGLKKYCKKSNRMNCVPPEQRPQAGYPARLLKPNKKSDKVEFGCLSAFTNAVSEKTSLSGGSMLEVMDQSTKTNDNLVNKQVESYTDYSKMSAEDASARLGAEDQTDFGWVGDAMPLTNEWSGEQLHRVYQGDLCRGDQRIAEKMREIGQHAQQSIINRVAFHKNSLTPYVSEELDANENVDWWTDNQDLDAEMVKDGKPIDK